MRIAVVLLAGSMLTAGSIALAAGGSGATATTQAKNGTAGIDLSNLDRNCQPCQDFFTFATAGWVTKHPIPAAFPRWGTFDALAERNQEQLRGILEKAAADASAKPGSIERKLGDFWAAAMDEKKIDAEGAKPLAPELARIEAVTDTASLAAEVAHLQTLGVNALFQVGSRQDAKDATKVIAAVAQGGLGLPDRDYYLKDDARSKSIRDAYVAHVTRIFELLGDAPAKAATEAKTVLALETGMAKISMSRVERRDPKKTYNPTEVAALVEEAPAFAWKPYFSELGLASLKSLNVGQPAFFEGMSADLAKVELGQWKTYLRWHLAAEASPYLSSDFVKENFAFSRTLTGAKEDQPRWRKAVAATNAALGEDLGQLYVKEYFSPASKAKVLEILHNIRAALKDDLTTLPWMSQATRTQALAKLAKIEEKIGYPDKWKDYSALAIDRTSYLGNMFRAAEFEFQRDLAKIGQPVDRTEWHMTPPTVNAYYNPSMNEIVFPAGILQPPFFDPNADDAVNYGAIGAVMGHEITHGFDDHGSQYDGNGNLRDWWAPADLAAFKARGEKIVNQASAYAVDADTHLNGKLVEGEAIADVGGVTLAYKAYQRSLQGKPKPPVIDGFTGNQRFFLGFATVWASSVRPEFARMLATVDPHPAARYRVNATLANIPAFAEAFGCKQGQSMVLDAKERADIW